MSTSVWRYTQDQNRTSCLQFSSPPSLFTFLPYCLTGNVQLFVCLSIPLALCSRLTVCLSVSVSVHLSICLSVCLSYCITAHSKGAPRWVHESRPQLRMHWLRVYHLLISFAFIHIHMYSWVLTHFLSSHAHICKYSFFLCIHTHIFLSSYESYPLLCMHWVRVLIFFAKKLRISI